MVKKKTKSKRLSLHKKYKILRKVREHKRKERKNERKGVGKKKKTPGIPNNWPFKEELLLQEEQARLAEIERLEKLKTQRKAEKAEKKKAEKRIIDGLAQVPTLTPLSVKQRAQADLKAAVTKADLVVIVLDARDPQGCRALSLEDGLIGHGKKDILLVLNKADLISRDTAEKWVTYLRRFHPTVAVRAADKSIKDVTRKTQSSSSLTSAALHARAQELSTLRDNGFVDPLAHALDDYVRSKKLAPNTFVNVALVGYPNVGKSTLFNSLKRKSIAHVSSKPHTTKALSEAQLGEHIHLIDTPALETAFCDPANVLVKFGLAEEYTMEPVEAVDSVLARADMWNVMQITAVGAYKSTEDFLKKYAVKKQLTRKGGDADVLLAARSVLQALTHGGLPTMTLAPSQSKSRFDLPKWFAMDPVAELEQKLYATNPLAKTSSYLTLKCQGSSHRTGETTEYDVVMGTLKFEDFEHDEEDDEDVNDEEDEDEDSEEVDDAEVEEEDDVEDVDDVEEEEDDDVVEVPPPKRGAKKAAPTKIAAKQVAALSAKMAATSEKKVGKKAAATKDVPPEPKERKSNTPDMMEAPKVEAKKRAKKEAVKELVATKKAPVAKVAEKTSMTKKAPTSKKETVVTKKETNAEKMEVAAPSRKRGAALIEESSRRNPKRATRTSAK
ncbi:hypothetical protein, variant [Aphanomyces invadans]|uniref:CP-type G domain-containing protein n=1 Tax=Aphanomyces invadans TaxID=157072 RepID=A0A024TXB1_9STRA|nr:hypothetical protein, variant [Aphanomyces invadans]ETV98271.1 hypothetical protein, variant [Aphanomyces invadans]|eukprot:XP_008873146.1 hypothetical protein, variant [Aphanomyces invadans]